ncbi:hypothetical protein HDU67_006153 [Dinochytrium kinnereticum]|nr:hypothetical protein HDU67_006153 [Dinochytrium kinnereticum]
MFRTLVSRKEYPDYYKVIKNPVALDMIQSRIESGAYAEFDDMAADFVLLAKNAMTYNEPKSEICRDAQTIKSLFDSLLSKEIRKAAADTATAAAAAAAAAASAKAVSEAAAKAKASAKTEALPAETVTPVSTLELFKKDGQEYRTGDFVYIVNPVEPEKPTIGQIMSIFPTPPPRKPPTIPPTSTISFTANWYLRPEQTVHKATAKFMENEVLKSNRTETYTTDEVVGKCWVLFVKDYVRGRPKECKGEMKHVYVCESRYNDQAKSSARIKQWNSKLFDEDLEMYPTPIVPVKVNSVFAEEKDLVVKPVKVQKATTPGPVEDAMQVDSVPPVKHHYQPTIKIVDHQAGKHHASHSDVHHDKRIKLTVKPLSSTEPRDSETVVVKPKLDPSTTPSVPAPPPKTSTSASAIPPPPAPLAPQIPVISDTVASNFDMTPEGHLRWYSGVPVHVVGGRELRHSLEYLAWVAERRMKSGGEGMAGGAGVGVKRRRDSGVEKIREGLGRVASELIGKAIEVKVPLR